MEEGLGKVLTQGIEVGWPEEGDRGEGATSRRAVELRSALDEMRRKRELTSGSHIRPDKYLAMPRGLSASLERTVRESGVTILPPKRNLAPRFNEWLKGALDIDVYLDMLVAIPDI